MKNEKIDKDKIKYDLFQHNAAASFFQKPQNPVSIPAASSSAFSSGRICRLFRNPEQHKSLATISIWVIWWSLLIISLALAGRIWCFMCPFGAIGDWVQRRTFYKKVTDTFTLNRKMACKIQKPFPGCYVFFL